MFTEYDFLDRFKVAKKHGFSAVEIQFPYEFPLTKVLAAKESAGVSHWFAHVQLTYLLLVVTRKV